MDTILKWEVCSCNDTCNYPDPAGQTLQELCRKGWEPFAFNSQSCKVLLKRPCGEIAISKHPEIFQRLNNNHSGVEY